jgi:DNA-binding Xre family transcriptional regulator
MISYKRLWETMKEKKITQYDLYTHHGINRPTLDRLRHDKNMETFTLNKLCNILQCNIEEIMEHIPDEEE